MINSSGIIPLCKENGEWKVLLIQHRGFEQYWSCPKGHVEPNETRIEAAYRELKEETGLRVKNLRKEDPLVEEFYWFNKGERLLKRVFFFIAEVEGKIDLQKEEIVGAQWFTLHEAIQKVVYEEGKETLKQVECILTSEAKSHPFRDE